MKAKHVIAVVGIACAIFATPFPYITFPVAAFTGLAMRGAIYCCNKKKEIQEDRDEPLHPEADSNAQPSHEAILTSISSDGSRLFIFESNTPSPAKAVGVASIINGVAGCNLFFLSKAIGGSILNYLLPATGCVVSCIVLSRVIKAHLEDNARKFCIIGSFSLIDPIIESDTYSDSNEMLLGGELAELQTAYD